MGWLHVTQVLVVLYDGGVPGTPRTQEHDFPYFRHCPIRTPDNRRNAGCWMNQTSKICTLGDIGTWEYSQRNLSVESVSFNPC